MFDLIIFLILPPPPETFPFKKKRQLLLVRLDTLILRTFCKSFTTDVLQLEGRFLFSPQQTMEWRAPVLCWTQGRRSDTSASEPTWSTFSSVIVLSRAGAATYNWWTLQPLAAGHYRNFQFAAIPITQPGPSRL